MDDDNKKKIFFFSFFWRTRKEKMRAIFSHQIKRDHWQKAFNSFYRFFLFASTHSPAIVSCEKKLFMCVLLENGNGRGERRGRRRRKSFST
jgi:hypothetical protein